MYSYVTSELYDLVTKELPIDKSKVGIFGRKLIANQIQWAVMVHWFVHFATQKSSNLVLLLLQSVIRRTVLGERRLLQVI